MAPEVYEEARANAPIHVQLIRIGGDPMRGRIAGRIVRIFRDRDHQVHWGQRIAFMADVIDRSQSGPPVLSGTLYQDGERLERARWLEAFLEMWNGELQLVRSQLVPVRHPTWRPVCGPDLKGFLGPIPS